MPENTASRTALSVAWLRAAHQVLDTSPLVLNDPAVLALLGPSAKEEIRLRVDELQVPGARSLRSHVVLRSRFAEDRMSQAVKRGIRQYILLGAGYDTFCIRQPEWASVLRIIEVDQPATQNGKKSRLEMARIPVPENVNFLPVDFERETLRYALARGNVDPTIPTFFSCLGVTVYLTEAAVDALFLMVAEFPRSSEIVFTFTQPHSTDTDPSTRVGAEKLAAQAAAVGEPWQSYFTVDALTAKLAEFGFEDIYFLTPDKSQREYFADRTDGLPIPRRTSIASAIR
jgi:methyltransferase (TIGR00027 family)